jgi:hypothetical protein
MRPADVVTASAMFEQNIAQGRIQHMGQPSLTSVVANCEHRNIGSGGGFGYNAILTGADISILESVVMAQWLCSEAKEKKAQTFSY